MENITFTDFSVAHDFVKDAMDEYYTTKNWTGLLERYWMLIEEQIGGECHFYYREEYRDS